MSTIDKREARSGRALSSPTQLTLAEVIASGRATITVEEAGIVFGGLKRTAAYDAVRRGQLPSLRIGRRLFVPVAALISLLEGRSFTGV